MNTYCKTLHTQDYAEAGMGLWITTFDWLTVSGVAHMPNPHLHRRWEYGMAMNFLSELRRAKKHDGDEFTVLDVGGGGSLFHAIARHHQFDVMVVDPDPSVYMMHQQSEFVRKPPQYLQARLEDVEFPQQFDAVVSLSAIEHVPEDKLFMQKLGSLAKQGVFVTTDFSMSGRQYSPAHLRTYTPKTLLNKLARQLKDDFVLYGTPEWEWYAPDVYDYSFASLAMTRKHADSN